MMKTASRRESASVIDVMQPCLVPHRSEPFCIPADSRTLVLSDRWGNYKGVL